MLGCLPPAMPLGSVFSPPQWGPWASGPPSKARMTVDPWALGQPLPGSGYSTWALGLGPTGKARGTPDREKPVAPPLGGEYSREEAR